MPILSQEFQVGFYVAQSGPTNTHDCFMCIFPLETAVSNGISDYAPTYHDLFGLTSQLTLKHTKKKL